MNDKVQKLKNSLTSAVTQTMENMTFEEVSTIPNGKVKIVSASDAIWALLPLARPYVGNLLLNASFEYSESLVHEVYGFCEDEAIETSIKDVMSEIANTIAGRFLGEFVPADEEFELGLPSSGKGNIPGLENEVIAINLKIGEHFLKVSLFGSDFVNFVEN